MGATRIFMLGRFDIWCNEQRLTSAATQKACELVAYLLVFRGAPHHRDRLATMLWAEASPTQARTYLRKTLWQIQSTVPEDSSLFQVDPEWVEASKSTDCWLDLTEFERAYLAAKGVAGHALSAEQRRELQQAVALYRGDLLEGWYQDWCLLERERLLRMNLIMLDKLVEHALHYGDFESGIDYANQLLRWDHARERTHYDLMCLYAMAGERTAVLNQFELCRAILRDELGVEPAAHTVELYEKLCRQDFQPPALMRNGPPYNRELTQILHTLDHVGRSVDQLQQEILRQLTRNGA